MFSERTIRPTDVRACLRSRHSGTPHVEIRAHSTQALSY
jgi:hypothetical protein